MQVPRVPLVTLAPPELRELLVNADLSELLVERDGRVLLGGQEPPDLPDCVESLDFVD